MTLGASLRPPGPAGAEQGPADTDRTRPLGARPPRNAPPAAAKIDRFAILEKIGAGGEAEVFAAHDPKLDRRVALEVLLPSSAGGGRRCQCPGAALGAGHCAGDPVRARLEQLRARLGESAAAIEAPAP